ncbi:Phenazine biosynthesis protein PhzF [Castellaniella defragrans 65Phen]|uniref:Phenazine biosynthesis protein PhzF n=1 Tax=Castellaniella defragrans (strain DSM 12143 / CCUG 39792 / 65Phen) TaxID=1437824 RepID=W8X180_CASD6|nr:PhzF family phenazine biosynthesis protein [Castellaniella defragrans]CDM25659.1 Phenazine biosynthesis protein PhzF [Castellaniella defragrans 65Phen]
MTLNGTASQQINGYPVDRLAAFSDGDSGGNPAGVVICEALPDAVTMQAIAAEIGYSETAFAALAGYLRDAGWPHGGAIDILQGEDMGSPSRIHAEIPPEIGASIRISGTVRASGGS